MLKFEFRNSKICTCSMGQVLNNEKWYARTMVGAFCGSGRYERQPKCPNLPIGRPVREGRAAKFCFADVYEMAPILKDSDVLTTPEATARSGSSSTSSTESPVKAQPVALEIPITVNGARAVEGSDKREPFSESTKTVMVFGSGAVIRLTSATAPGQLLFLTNEHTKKEVVCQVVKSKNYRNASGYVELEFTETAVGFWGMRFPGDRIGPGPQAAQAETRTPATGNGAPAPARPTTPKTEQPAASDAPRVNGAKPSAPASSSAKPPASATGSPIVPPAFVSSTVLPGASKAKPNANASPAPIATSLAADTPLVEPWLKKREPAPRVSAAPPSVASAALPSPPAKSAEPESNLTPVRSFAVERPSDKAASLFAPAAAPTNLASVDLSSLAPFFEVKSAVAEAPVAPPNAPAASDPETEELKQHTARLQDQLAKMQFAETASSSAAKVEAEKLEEKKLEAEKPAAPEVETPAFPLTEHSFETLKAELVHESAVQLVENPEPAKAAPVLPELSKLDEPVKFEEPVPLKVEPPAAIPALESLEQEEMKIPAWLEPLARNSSAPSSTQELVLREKTKRRAEQPQLQELVAPLVTPAEEKRVIESRVPQFGSVLPFEEANTVSKSSQKKSSNGTLLGGIAAGILTLAAGGWWFMDQQTSGVHSEAAAMQAVSTRPQDSQPKEAALGSVVPGHADAASSQTKSAEVNSNAPSSLPSSISSPAAASSTASTARGPQGSSNALNGGRAATKADAVEPELVQAVEKKPALGEVHLAAPKISQKRTAQTATAPDPGVLNEDQPADTADSLGGLAVASNQPAAPSAPVGVGGDVKQAKLISSVPPAYPAMAKSQHISGAVTIDALIDANGRVTTMKVISGPTLLQGAAMDALKQWKYQPATLNGNAVPMHLTVTLQFRLQQ
jgi:TonB family protein